MTRKIRLVVGILSWTSVLASVTIASAQETSEEEKLATRVSHFLESVSAGTTDEAFKELLRGSQLITQSEAIDGLIEKTNQIPQRYGQYRAFEAVDTKRIGKDLVLMRYLYKCENFPVVWYFTFYRTPDRDTSTTDGTWRIIAIRFDTQLELLAFK